MDEAIVLMNRLAGSPKPISGATWVDNALYLRLSGASEAVMGTVDEWVKKYDFTVVDNAIADQFWQCLRDHTSEFFRDHDIPLWRFSVNSAASAWKKDQAWVIDWCGSQRWLSSKADPAELQEWAEANGGEVIMYRGGAGADSEVFYQPNPVIVKLQKNVKHAFDPHNIFNVGRLYSA